MGHQQADRYVQTHPAPAAQSSVVQLGALPLSFKTKTTTDVI